MKFVATEMAGILQNIPHAITKKDVADAVQAAYLSVFPGNSMHGTPDPSSYPLGYYPYVHIMLVKGAENDKATGKWAFRLWGGGNNYAYLSGIKETSLGYSTGTTSASSFYPELRISDGEYKIILQCAVYYDHAGAYSDNFSDGPYKGKKCGQVPVRSAFGFYIIGPQGVGARKNGFFPDTVIFTPKPGLFSGTPPQ